MSTPPAIVPPPWSLTGSGYVLAYKFPREFIESNGFLPSPELGDYIGGLGVVMLVDYATSEAGGYRELLFIPGQFQHPHGKFYSITKIYVSTEVSVVSGRANWGIPKELADFTRETTDGTDHITVSQNGQTFAQFRLRPRGLALPTTTQLIPASWRTLIQQHMGQLMLTTPEASGRARQTRVEDIQITPSAFPDIAQFRPITALYIPRFTMRFPLTKPLSTENAS